MCEVRRGFRCARQQVGSPGRAVKSLPPKKATQAMASRVASNPTHYEQQDGVCFGRRPASMPALNLHHRIDRIGRANAGLRRAGTRARGFPPEI